MLGDLGFRVFSMGEGEKDLRFPFRVGGVRFRVYGLGFRPEIRLLQIHLLCSCVLTSDRNGREELQRTRTHEQT